MKLYDTVRIKDKNIIGVIVDISHNAGGVHYVVESSAKGPVEGADGGAWPLFDCGEDDIERIMA